MSHTSGKAILRIHRDSDEGYCQYACAVFPQSGHFGEEDNHLYHWHYWVTEAIQLAVEYHGPICGRMKKMEAGDLITVAVNFTINGYTSYEGEYDEDVEFTKVRVLRHQKGSNK